MTQAFKMLIFESIQIIKLLTISTQNSLHLLKLANLKIIHCIQIVVIKDKNSYIITKYVKWTSANDVNLENCSKKNSIPSNY